jgi:hypothetical protein
METEQSLTGAQYLKDDAQETEEEKKALRAQAMLIQEPAISVNQIIALMAKTPKSYIYQRPAKGKAGNWDYVSGGYVKKCLNRIFGWNWNFEIVDKFKDEGEVIVQGRLTIRNKNGGIVIVKEDFGKKEIVNMKNSTKPVSIGNDYKSAATDCLKRCAYQLGLASDVYAPREFRELENPEEAIYDETKQTGEYLVNCNVCGKEFTTDKRFLKECAECALLSKEEKKAKKEAGKPADNKKEPF